MNWRNIAYLQHGTPRQQAAHATIIDLGVIDALRPFDPALVSTVCVDLDVPGSDLDVICELHDAEALAATIRTHFADRPHFSLRRTTDPARLVAAFETTTFPVEIYAEPCPVDQQSAYRHLTAMARLLNRRPKTLRHHVRRLKRAGWKTEPAFAHCLGLDGDPYAAMLALEAADDATLDALLCRASLL